MQVIYQIKNTINGKSYIGSSIHFNIRKSEHLLDLRKGNHHSRALQRAVNKYGIEHFSFHILEHVENKLDLISREQYYLDTLKPEYNTCKVAYSLLGFKKSAEDNLQNSLRNSGFGNGNAKIKPEDIETIKKLTPTHSNKAIADILNVSESAIERSRSKYGIKKDKKIFSEEARRKMSIAAKDNFKATCVKVYKFDKEGNKIFFESKTAAAKSVGRTVSTLHQAINEGRACNGVMFYLSVEND